MLGEARLEPPDCARQGHATLVGEPRQESAHGVGGKLVDVRRDDAPGALDEELHHERTGHEQGDRGGERPEGNHDRRGAEGEPDRAPAAQSVGVETERDTGPQSPIMETMVMSPSCCALKPQWRCRNVGYMTCVPCDTMFT